MRLAVLADIHGNRAALDAVLDDLRRRGGADRVVDLGDSVSGPLWPQRTLARLREVGALMVRGNHDRIVGGGGRAAMGPSDAFAYDDLDEPARRLLEDMPPMLRPMPLCLALHGTPAADDDYLLDSIVDGRLVRARLDTIEARMSGVAPEIGIVLCGHSHRADMVQLPNGLTIVNPGSVGCPAYDDTDAPAHVSEAGHPFARYAVIEIGHSAGLTRIDMAAVAYDHESAAVAAERNGRADWAFALRTGSMPRGETDRLPF